MKANPREGELGAGRQGDRYVDGKLTEYKSLTGVRTPNEDSLSRAISNRVMNGRGQAPNIILDARGQPGMTKEIAQRGISRAFGADTQTGDKLRSIRVLGKDFDITSFKSPK